jgi:hypothetical protein
MIRANRSYLRKGWNRGTEALKLNLPAISDPGADQFDAESIGPEARHFEFCPQNRG